MAEICPLVVCRPPLPGNRTHQYLAPIFSVTIAGLPLCVAQRCRGRYYYTAAADGNNVLHIRPVRGSCKISRLNLVLK